MKGSSKWLKALDIRYFTFVLHLLLIAPEAGDISELSFNG